MGGDAQRGYVGTNSLLHTRPVLSIAAGQAHLQDAVACLDQMFERGDDGQPGADSCLQTSRNA